MTVVITGGSGPVGTAITDHLAGEYEFLVLDLAEHPDPSVPADRLDVTEYDVLRSRLDDVDADAVIDLTRQPMGAPFSSGGREAAWGAALATNLEATATVFRAAADAGVDRLVFGSSNHVVGMYEYANRPELYYPGYGLTVDHTVAPRPDSMYGVWKLYGEGIGRMLADVADLRFYALRICALAGPDRETPAAYAESLAAGGVDPDGEEFEHRVRRKQAMWCSRRDLAQLVDCCLRDGSVTADVFYGVSDNATRWFDLEHARELLGYEPVDDGSEWTAFG